MTTDERNILIAEFKGWKYNEETERLTKGSLAFRLGSFEYDKSWDMLIGIIKLITTRFDDMMKDPNKGIYEYFDDNQIDLLEEEYYCISDDIGTAVMTNDIEFAHKIVAEYIEKFNNAYEDAKQQHAAEKYEGSDYDQG